MTTNFKQEMARLFRACFSGTWVESPENDEVERELASMVHEANQQPDRKAKWQITCWDASRGFYDPLSQAGTDEAGGPESALKPPIDDQAGTSILVLHNYHRYLANSAVVQALANRIRDGKKTRRFTVIVSPTVTLPPELDKLVTVVDYALPDAEELKRIADSLATGEDGNKLEVVSGAFAAAAGMTRYEAEAAFTLSLVRNMRIEPETVWEQKARIFKRTNNLTLHRDGPGFDSIGGLASVKEFAMSAMSSRERSHGILMFGVPGAGKSQFCRALSRESGRPLIMLDIGSMHSKYVGESEQNTRRVLRIADATAPCILMADEIEKGLAGIGSNDSGVSDRIFGTLLTWMSDRTSDVFLVATSNDVSRLPPEFSRAERFDAVFFVDLPERAEKDAIWRMYIQQYKLDPGSPRPDDDRWTGAEIKACCRLASMLGKSLRQAGQYVIPVASTSYEKIESLRAWADRRCLDASKPGVYTRSIELSIGTRKRDTIQ